MKRKGIKGSRKKKQGRNGRKKGGRPRERERQKRKKTGENRGGGRKEKERRKRSRAERQARRRKNTRQKEKTGRGRRHRPVSLRRGEEELPRSAGFSSNRHRSATKNSRQHHRQLSHPRSSPQVNSLPLHSCRSLVIFLLAERALCTFCMQEEAN